MRGWQMQEAKARFAELTRRAESEGPQSVTVRGREAIVVLSRRDYDRLTAPATRFTEFIGQSPLKGARIRTVRDKSLTRDVKL